MGQLLTVGMGEEEEEGPPCSEGAGYWGESRVKETPDPTLTWKRQCYLQLRTGSFLPGPSPRQVLISGFWGAPGRGREGGMG